jgi:hypothetical protein
LFPSAAVQGGTAPGYSTGFGLATMQKIAEANLPAGYAYSWTELAFQEKLAGNTGIFIFLASVVFVFLLLAAQYESWTLPLAVILIVPMCLLAAVTGLLLRTMDVNILAQIGFVVLIGLAAKNAIGGGGRGGPVAAAADPNDFLCLHSGRVAADDRDRRRRRDAAVARHRRVLWHAGRHVLRLDLYPGVLRCDAPIRAQA